MVRFILPECCQESWIENASGIINFICYENEFENISNEHMVVKAT